MRKTKEKIPKISETGIGFFFETDLKQNIIFSTPDVETVLGYKAEEVIEKSFFDYVLVSELPKAFDAFEKTISESRVSYLEIKIRNKNGKLLQLEIKLIPIYMEDEITGIQGIGRVIDAPEEI